MAFHYLVMPQMTIIKENNLLVSILVLLQKVLAIIPLEVSVSFRNVFVLCCNLMLFMFIVTTIIKCF